MSQEKTMVIMSMPMVRGIDNFVMLGDVWELELTDNAAITGK